MKEEEFFLEYTSKYDKTSPGIDLKYNHSFRVVEKAILISNSINLDKKDKNFVRVCALFHDIARFEQYAKYNTFDDSKSFDHGDKGAEILRDNGFTNEVLLNVVKYHNKLDVPKELDDRSMMFLKIIRDADKIDIIENQGYNCKTKNYTISSELKDFFIKHKPIGRDLKSKPEGNIVVLLRMLAYIFDLNFYESFKIIKEQDLINIKCDIIKESGNEGIEEIRKLCNEYIESRL